MVTLRFPTVLSINYSNMHLLNSSFLFWFQVGYPICNLRSGCLEIGRIAWIEKDHRSVDVARLGDTVMIKVGLRLSQNK